MHRVGEDEEGAGGSAAMRPLGGSCSRPERPATRWATAPFTTSCRCARPRFFPHVRPHTRARTSLPSFRCLRLLPQQPTDLQGSSHCMCRPPAPPATKGWMTGVWSGFDASEFDDCASWLLGELTSLGRGGAAAFARALARALPGRPEVPVCVCSTGSAAGAQARCCRPAAPPPRARV